MPVNATRLIRKMRGGAQAHLLEAEDGHCYVTKFTTNPQHRRVLVNEWLAHSFLKYLQITCPEVAVVNVSESLLSREPEIHLQLGSRREAVEPGWHFGSRFPGDPHQLAVYDYLPDNLLEKTVNRQEFLAVLVFDKWAANADSRQAIFFRSRLREFLDLPEVAPQQKGFLAQMVDQGYVFNGPQWEFSDSPLQGLYFRHRVYEGVTGLGDFEPWLERVVHMPDSVMDDALRQVPRGWLDGDEPALEQLLELLWQRRRKVPELLRGCRSARQNPFPNWV